MTTLNENEQEISLLIDQLSSRISDPKIGLVPRLFQFISQLTPMINVDLLIRNEINQTLLTWREDEFYGPGWHIPGGIIRFKETSKTRIVKVAQSELGATVEIDTSPLMISEIMASQRNIRGHFISLLYYSNLISPLDQSLIWQETAPKNGGWRWFDECPNNLISVHEIYHHYISSNAQFKKSGNRCIKKCLPLSVAFTTSLR